MVASSAVWWVFFYGWHVNTITDPDESVSFMNQSTIVDNRIAIKV